jgi:hypothetical protein
LVAKQTRIPFPHSTHWRADETLELVHVDLCGPITPSTVGGNKYFMLIIDDCTRWSTMFMLKSKDQAVEAFVKFKAQAENSCGNKIKVIRLDRGGEFWLVFFRQSVIKLALEDNSLVHTHHSIMVWWRERIGQLWR